MSTQCTRPAPSAPTPPPPPTRTGTGTGTTVAPLPVPPPALDCGGGTVRSPVGPDPGPSGGPRTGEVPPPRMESF